MTGSASFKLSLLARRRHLPPLPGQSSNTDFGFIWDACPMPVGGSCYVVEFDSRSMVTIIAYVDGRGGVYLVDRPIEGDPDGDPVFAIVPDEEDRSGNVYMRGPVSGLRRAGRYRGSLRGSMREVSDRETWNSTRSLTYRPFVASMFLRYCVLGRSEDELPPLLMGFDLSSHELDHEVDLFASFKTESIADAVDAVLFRLGEQDSPAGIERFAQRVLSEVDAQRLRAISPRVEMSLAYIESMRGFYVNFNHEEASPGDAALIFQFEFAMNRILHVLEALGIGLEPACTSPSEAACSIMDQRALRGITGAVERLLASLNAPNRLGRPGTRGCAPGGEWDVRTRFAQLGESINTVVRFWYDMRCNVDDGVMLVRYLVPVEGEMPRSLFGRGRGLWREVGAGERVDVARELAARMALLVAAAAFASGFQISRVLVEQQDITSSAVIRTYDIPRAGFMAELVDLAYEVDGVSLREPRVLGALERYAYSGEVPAINSAETLSAPREDGRTLPEGLRGTLYADFASELEVMEDPDDPLMGRLAGIRRRLDGGAADAEGALGGFLDGMEARCAAAELLSDRPFKAVFCENYLGRVLLPLEEGDGEMRFGRLPDALYFARYEVCVRLMRRFDYEGALSEARGLVDMAPTSMQAHYVLINVLASLQMYQEVIEVCRHALRVAYDRESIAYLMYRIAFAFWRVGDAETALACYRLVPEGRNVSDVANEEMEMLMAQRGLSAPPSFAEAVSRLERAGVPIAPTPEVSARVADAAVLLADGGFFFLAGRCVYHMWNLSGRDELSVVQRSFGPQW